MGSSRAALAALCLAAAAILSATLYPLPPPPGVLPPVRSWLDDLVLSNLLRNVALFAPLGASLAGLGIRRPALVGAALSALVELAQLGIPGRYPGLIDVATNAAGAALGAACVRSAPRWIHPPPRRERALCLGAGGVLLAGFVATGWLYAPAPSGEVLYGHRPPDLAHLYPYGGEVRGAWLDETPVPQGPFADSARIRARLRGDYRLRVEARAGPEPPHLAGLLAITDAVGREIVLLGIEGDTVVFRARNRSSWLGLEPARLRIFGALAGVREGDALELGIERRDSDLCATLPARRACGLGFTLGDAWQLLAPDYSVLARARGSLGAVWIALVCVPLGFWARRDAATAAAWAGAGAGLLLAPVATGLLATPVHQLVAAAAGAFAGRGLRRVAARRL